MVQIEYGDSWAVARQKINEIIQTAENSIPSIGPNGHWFLWGNDTGINAQGPQGEQGLKWDKGATWDRGPQWIQGEKWATGPQWETGPQGIQWEQGPKGEQWPTGEKWAKGDKGDTGPQWPAGQNGTNGTNGTNGRDGKDGASIIDADFVKDNIVFYKDDKTEVVLKDAVKALTWPEGPQWPTWPQWPQGPAWTYTAGQGIDITNNTISTTFNYGESDTAAATVQKEVSIPSITELNVGQVIIVKPTVTSTVANSTLKVNNFDAYGMLYNGASITTSTDSIVWTANVPSMFILDEVSGTRYWRFLGHGLDSNTTYTLNRLIDPTRCRVWVGTYAVTRYSLIMEKADGTWEKITDPTKAYSTATTKTVNTNWFRLWHIRYYNTTTNLANWALVAANAIDIQAPSINGSYSFNCWTTPGRAVWTPIYLVGTLWADGLFYLDATQWRATQLPNTNDWKLYIKIWASLSADNSTFTLIAEKPVYYHNGTKICEYDQEANEIIYKRPSSGTYVLKSVDGVLSWVAE